MARVTHRHFATLLLFKAFPSHIILYSAYSVFGPFLIVLSCIRTRHPTHSIPSHSVSTVPLSPLAVRLPSLWVECSPPRSPRQHMVSPQKPRLAHHSLHSLPPPPCLLPLQKSLSPPLCPPPCQRLHLPRKQTPLHRPLSSTLLFLLLLCLCSLPLLHFLPWPSLLHRQEGWPGSEHSLLQLMWPISRRAHPHQHQHLPHRRPCQQPQHQRHQNQ